MSVSARLLDVAEAIQRSADAGETLEPVDLQAIAAALRAEVRLLRNAELAQARRAADARARVRVAA